MHAYVRYLTSFVHPCRSALPTNTVSPSKSPSNGSVSDENSSWYAVTWNGWGEAGWCGVKERSDRAKGSWIRHRLKRLRLHHITLHYTTLQHSVALYSTSQHMTSRHRTTNICMSYHITSNYVTWNHITASHITSWCRIHRPPRPLLPQCESAFNRPEGTQHTIKEDSP